MREVEVLHDFLLDVFNNDPAIKPRDILVMMPDSETYAPFIQAVFVASGENNGHIPYEIADQTVRRQSTLAKTCFAVLRLGTERFGVSRVLDILECAAVQRRFNLLPADIDCIHRWVRETRICWGRDGAFRSSLGLPPFKQTTWQAGVERLLLGYAMPQQEERLFSGILPYGTIEGSDAHILGGFLSFLDALFNAVPSSGALLPPVQWQEKLLSLVDALFLPDDDAQDELQTLRTVIERLGTLARQAGFTGPVGLDVVLSWLDYAAREEYIGRRFLTGGVTFCAMLPMRSIPFKVICMIGMQDAAFPRKASTHSSYRALAPSRRPVTAR
jgi:exodeoxyribonuclease V gamma subunit